MNDDDKNAFVQWGVAAASIVRRGKIIIAINYTNKPLHTNTKSSFCIFVCKRYQGLISK